MTFTVKVGDTGGVCVCVSYSHLSQNGFVPRRYFTALSNLRLEI